MKICFILFCFLLLTTISSSYYIYSNKKNPSSLKFNTKSNEKANPSTGDKSPFTFLKNIFKRKEQEKLTHTPKTDYSQRYRLILVSPDTQYKRHIITRLTRFLNDLSFDSARDIVDHALDSNENRSLIRVFSNLVNITHYIILY